MQTVMQDYGISHAPHNNDKEPQNDDEDANNPSSITSSEDADELSALTSSDEYSTDSIPNNEERFMPIGNTGPLSYRDQQTITAVFGTRLCRFHNAKRGRRHGHTCQFQHCDPDLEQKARTMAREALLDGSVPNQC